MSLVHISSVGGVRRGPYPEDQVREMLEDGRLSPSDLYWVEGMADWSPVSAWAAAHPGGPEVEPGERRFRFRRHPEPLTTFVKAMLLISLAAAALSLGSDGLQLNLLQSTYTEAEGEANDDRQQVVALFNLIILLVTAFAFLKWTYRANLNSRGFGAQGMTFTPGWVIGCYFIPIINLFRPYQAMKEIWQVSGDPGRWKEQPVSPLLGCWWALWLANGLLGQVSMRMSLGAKTRDDFVRATEAALLGDTVDAAVCVVAFTLVSAIVARQRALVERDVPNESDGANPPPE